MHHLHHHHPMQEAAGDTRVSLAITRLRRKPGVQSLVLTHLDAWPGETGTGRGGKKGELCVRVRVCRLVGMGRVGRRGSKTSTGLINGGVTQVVEVPNCSFVTEMNKLMSYVAGESVTKSTSFGVTQYFVLHRLRTGRRLWFHLLLVCVVERCQW